MSSSTSATNTQKSTLVQRELAKAQNLVKDDATAIGTISLDAVQSGAYLYPLQGIFYILTHRKLWESIKPLVYKGVVTSGIVLAAMFIFTYLPQVALLAFVSGPLAFIAAVPAVLAESLVIINFLTKSMFAASASDAVFDAVLVQKGYSSLVEKGRTVKKNNKGIVMGKSLLKPITGKFSTEGMVRYVLTLPLNAIPVLGTAFFVGYNGIKAGPSCHSHYHALLDLTPAEKTKFVEQNRGAYTAFGTMSILLGMIPFVGAVSALSNAAGAALWAANLESRKAGGAKPEVSGEVSVPKDEL